MNDAAWHNDMLARRQGNTGQWFLTSPEYRRWLELVNGTLFCPGLPGGGKTIIVASVIEDLRNKFRIERGVGIAYIYCSYKRQHEQTLENCLASLLRSLVQQLDKIPLSVQNLYRQHKNLMTKPNVDELTDSLQAVIDIYHQVYLIVDGLDEYSKAPGELMRFLGKIFQLQSKRNVAFLATSRPNIPEIKRVFKETPELEISAKEEDVRQVLENAMPGMPTCISSSPDLQALVIDEITKAVNGMYAVDVVCCDLIRSLADVTRFLLTRLHLDSLRDKLRRKHVIQALKDLPKGSDALNTAYKEAIERIDWQRKGCRDLAKRVLIWISHARRPLTTIELRQALAVELDETEIDEGNLHEMEEIVSFCEGLVIVDEKSDIISLVHYTAQEYLDRVSDIWMLNPHKEIAHVCLAYLSFNEFSSGSCNNDSDFEDRLSKNALLGYCANNWGNHVRDADDEDVDEAALEFLGNSLRIASAVQVHMVSKYHRPGYSTRVPTRISAVHLAAQFGLSKIIACLVASGWNPDAKDDFGRSPLSYAAEFGHNDTAQMLIQRKETDPDASDEQGRTPLSWAAGGGHVDVLQTLVGCPSVNVNSKDSDFQSPLSWAARMGSVGAVKHLMGRSDVEKESRDRRGQTALSWAAYKGHLEILKMLAECSDVNANSKDDFSQTPLSWAARNGHIGVVVYLVNMPCVDADSRDEDNRTALTWAAIHGHVQVVKALASYPGLNPDTKDKHGQSPLSWAAREGHLDIVEYLITRDDVQVHTTDRRGLTPLRWAAWNGNLDVVTVLESTRRRRDPQ